MTKTQEIKIKLNDIDFPILTLKDSVKMKDSVKLIQEIRRKLKRQYETVKVVRAQITLIQFQLYKIL